MTHWHRTPKPVQVRQLLFQPNRRFIIDRVSVADVIDSLPIAASAIDQIFPEQHLSRGEIIARCQNQRRILISADPEYASLLVSEDRASWSVLLLPASASAQLETLRRVRSGSLVFNSPNVLMNNLEYFQRNRLLVDLHGEQPSFNVYFRCRWK
jgi:hypothetical protein